MDLSFCLLMLIEDFSAKTSQQHKTEVFRTAKKPSNFLSDNNFLELCCSCAEVLKYANYSFVRLSVAYLSGNGRRSSGLAAQ